VTSAPDPAALDPSNPFATASALEYGLPDFAAVREEHYLPALLAGIAQERAEVEAVLADSQAPTVENTLDQLERSGRLLARTAAAFFNQSSADSTAGLDAIEAQITPLLAAHHDSVQLDPRLLARLDVLQRAVDDGALTLEPDAAWLLHTMRKDAVRAGARLTPEAQDRLRALNLEISVHETAFGRILLAATNAAAVVLDDEALLAGLPADMVAAAQAAAEGRGHPGQYLLELQLPTQQPVLASLSVREVRERVHRASVTRGFAAGEHDTRGTVLALARLRADRAQLLGYPHHADYVAADGTARATETVLGTLTRLAPSAVANARIEETALTRALQDDVPGATLAPWDWSYYAERVRRERHHLDDAQLRPYLELERVLREGVFRAAGDLYGFTFRERPDLTGYHPDVRVFEVVTEDGDGRGLFLADVYTRESKRGGAWMDSLEDQSALLGTRAVVVNNLNITRPPAGQPTLLTFDEVITLFHEFGHALHALASDVRYPSQSGTSVPRDFVEFPSQVNEMWAWDPELLRSYAVHHLTAEPLPAELLEAMIASRQFNEGFATTEYLAAALLDQAWHLLDAAQVPTDPDDVEAFEADALERMGVALASVPPRYRTAYFNHVFGGGYAAAYYGYLWSEILDADTVDWFTENGGRTRANGETFRRSVLSRGGSIDPMAAFRDLRGREPRIEPLLARRGLTG
jgi:peptidyl-dipeptidase Dcp